MHDETIKDVSRTLVDLLKVGLADIAAHITLASPKNPGSNVLTLFLYKVIENAYLKNDQPPLPPPSPSGTLVQPLPPLTVDLYYLLTAHSGSGDLFEAHRALSRAIRVMHDNAVLRGSQLRANTPSTGLTADSVLRVSLNPISMEDMTRIWSVFPDTPYEISVTYLVTPVEIESARTLGGAPVVDQLHDVGHLTRVEAGL